MAALMNLERSAGSEPDPDVASTVFHRKIEFHLARKSFSGFGNNKRDNGFKLVTLNPSASEPNKISASGKKSEKSELSETGLDPEISFRITFRRIGAGLRNLGNTCFLNSVLQCLTYTEPLAAYLQSGKHQNSCRTAGFCALCAIQKHVSRALQSTGRILEPKDLVSNLRCISRNFRNARQEDAHEYMVNLLESMHKCCLPSGVPSESPSAYEKSLVHKIFGGRLRSQVKCMQCSFCSDKFDPFVDLSLEIVKADSLYKALSHFTSKEQLDGGAKQYQCQQCKQKVKALKQLTIHKAPHVLAIHLKRFGSHVQGQKINKNITFSPTLDLKPFVTGPYDGDLKYTLYGVLVHAGWSTHSGHYYCFVRTSSGMWYSLDDNQVIQVSEKKVLEQKAYMLFYVRDRKEVCVKKPLVSHKENMVMNAIEKAAYSKFNPELREKVQNGSTEKRLDGSSVALSEKAPITTDSKETPSKKIPFQNVNGTMAVDCLDLKTDPLSESSLVLPPKKALVEDHSNATINSVGHQGSTVEASGDNVNSVDAAKCYNDSANKNPSESVDHSNSEMVTRTSRSGDSAVKVDLKMSSELPGTTRRSICGIGKNKLSQVKVKRKLFKCQVTTMQLSSNIIFGSAFGLRKKKLKRRKSHSLEKKTKFDSDDKDKELSVQNISANGVVSTDAINDEFRQKVISNGTTLSSEKQEHTRPSVKQGPSNSEDQMMEKRQTGIMSILTRGLEETTVARWDGTGVSLSENVESQGVESFQIGYVGDEWDEEYDKGKRKKIRCSDITFGGPNLFQEIATRKNDKRKKAKLNKSRSGNLPFRI
ncbi:hypothetical protein ACJIZ3_020656 [Penstemon smallii]|uniref:Ubiquitin carboxyl-terminal hydrolase n=1 Tax=Penstemon smallii TaxID=265156 RepID=A0ABD3SJ85_9LAMI